MTKQASSLTGPEPAGMPRRQFLALGSAAVATLAATGLSADLLRSTPIEEESAPRLSVGFADTTIDRFAQPLFAHALVPASRFRRGDVSIGERVRVEVHGLVRQNAAAATPFKVAIDAMYRYGSVEAPFMAWSYARLPRHTASSAARPFDVPVGASRPLSLTVSTSSANDPVLRGTVDLTLAETRRSNKLRTGLYFIAMTGRGAETPHWSSIRAVAVDGETLPRLKVVTITGLQPVPFDYLVLSTRPG